MNKEKCGSNQEWKKQEEQICPEVHYKIIPSGIMITGCYGTDGQVILPDEIEGGPVTAIAPYTFAEDRIDEGTLVWTGENAEFTEDRQRICGSQVTEVWLPAKVTEIGRYAFYRCRNLRKLILTDSLLDMGGGALNGCRLSNVEIHFRKGKKSCLKSIVEEMRYQILAELLYYEENKEARILFPEHYEEAVENTPARIVVTHHHGAGGYYRQCFYNRELDYKKYDEMLYHVVAEEEVQTAVKLVLNRLRFPFLLGKEAKAAYASYLREHLMEAGRILAESEEIEELKFLSEKEYWTPEALDEAILAAAEKKKTEILSYLMDEKYKRYPKEKKKFEL